MARLKSPSGFQEPVFSTNVAAYGYHRKTMPCKSARNGESACFYAKSKKDYVPTGSSFLPVLVTRLALTRYANPITDIYQPCNSTCIRFLIHIRVPYIRLLFRSFSLTPPDILLSATTIHGVKLMAFPI